MLTARIGALLVLTIGPLVAWMLSRSSANNAARIMLTGATLSIIVTVAILLLWG